MVDLKKNIHGLSLAPPKKDSPDVLRDIANQCGNFSPNNNACGNNVNTQVPVFSPTSLVFYTSPLGKNL